MFMFNNPTIEFVVPEPQIRELRFSASVTTRHGGTRSMRITSRSEEDRKDLMTPLVLLKRQAERLCLESRQVPGGTIYTIEHGDKGLFVGYVEQAEVNLRYQAEDLALTAKAALQKWWAAQTKSLLADDPLIRDLKVSYVTEDGDCRPAASLITGVRFRTSRGMVPVLQNWAVA